MREVTLVKEPTIIPIFQMAVIPEGMEDFYDWLGTYRPECLPDPPEGQKGGWMDLFPHGGVEMDDSGQERELTGNEMLVEFAGRKCYDEHTEVLTQNGWVRFPNLQKGSAVAVFSQEKNEIVFEVPTEYIQKRHKGSMYCVESRAFSIRVTPDHDLFCRRKGVWGFAPAEELVGKKYGVRRAATYEGSGFQSCWPVPKGKEKEWATFLGFFLSEGSIVDGKKYKTGSRVIIYQKHDASDPILEAARALGLKPTVKIDGRNNVAAITIGNTQLANLLAEKCGVGATEKKIPREVFEWPVNIREALLDALMVGDGTTTNGHRVYTTCSEKLATDVQQLILMLGRPGSISFSDHGIRTPYPTSFKSNHPIYRVREGSQVVATVNNKDQHDWTQEEADEIVYCVTVPNRILVVRRNRKVFFCSNCYDSFGTKAGRRTNASYIEHTQQGIIPHRSIKYHAKMTFFISGISWRVSHEFIRNYVGSDRDQEGSPSEESTRYTFHPGHFVISPRDIEEGNEEWFREAMQASYDRYCQYVDTECRKYQERTGAEPKGMDRKRIYESAAGYMPKQVSTSLVWTTNPEALKKLFLERTDNSTDLEFQRFAKKWQKLCCARWPNLFPKVG